MGEDRPLVVRDMFKSVSTGMAWSPDGQHVATCSSDGSVVLIALGERWGSRTGGNIAIFERNMWGISTSGWQSKREDPVSVPEIRLFPYIFSYLHALIAIRSPLSQTYSILPPACDL